MPRIIDKLTVKDSPTEEGTTRTVVDTDGYLYQRGTKITASAAAINTLTGTDRGSKIIVVPMSTGTAGGGVFAWANPESSSIIILRVVLDVTTKTTAACTINVGTTATSATTTSDNLIDGLDINAATGVFSNFGNAGTNGKFQQKLAAGKWITASQDTGAVAGLVGTAYIEYMVV